MGQTAYVPGDEKLIRDGAAAALLAPLQRPDWATTRPIVQGNRDTFQRHGEKVALTVGPVGIPPLDGKEKLVNQIRCDAQGFWVRPVKVPHGPTEGVFGEMRHF